MKNNIKEIKVPQVGPNDLSVTIIEWNIDSNEKIKIGQHICTIESTKSSFEIESDFEGYIELLYDVDIEVDTLQTIAIVGPSIDELEKYIFDFTDNRLEEEKINKKGTKKAILKAKELKISIDKIDIEGIVKEKDVIKYFNTLKGNNDNEKNLNIKKSINLIGNSLEAKKLMLFSKQEIPHSYIEKEFEVDSMESFVNKYIESKSFMTNLSLIIKATGEALKKNENFNSYREESKINYFSKVNIGIVIDLDGRLAVPIVKNIPEKNIDDIVKELLEMRKKLILNNLSLENLIDGTFTISALDHTSATRFYPIIHPKQGAVLGFPTSTKKLYIDENKKVIQKRVVNLGLSFDHSYLNAAMGIDFLDQICFELENIINKKI